MSVTKNPELSAFFAKDRQKFAAAHFTLFPSGEVERLHGHNYRVELSLSRELGEMGLLLPFHEVKQILNRCCEAWDEKILLPGDSEWVVLEKRGMQTEVCVTTPLIQKFYSFPSEDCEILPVNNISCENLSLVFAKYLAEGFAEAGIASAFELRLLESEGQGVSLRVPNGTWDKEGGEEGR